MVIRLADKNIAQVGVVSTETDRPLARAIDSTLPTRSMCANFLDLPKCEYHKTGEHRTSD